MAEADIARGDYVVIRKGAVVKSTHPQRRTYVTKRAQKVKVHSIFSAYELDGVQHTAKVSWAGSGGYWCDAELADVVLADNANG